MPRLTCRFILFLIFVAWSSFAYAYFGDSFDADQISEQRDRWYQMDSGNRAGRDAAVIKSRTYGGEEPWDCHQGTIYLTGNLGYAFYKLDRINELIGSINHSAVSESAGTMPFIRGGFLGGGSLTYWVTHRILLGLGFNYASASAKHGNTSLGDNFELSVSEWDFIFKIGQPLSPEWVLFLEISPSLIQISNGHLTHYRSGLGGSDSDTRLSASNLGAKIMLGVDYKLKQDFAIGMDFGYRTYFRLKDDLDFNGFFLQAGCRLYLK